MFPSSVSRPPDGAEGFYGGLDEVPAFVRELPPIDAEIERALQAALHRVDDHAAEQTGRVQKPSLRGAVLKEIERGIANLDQWQRQRSPRGFKCHGA